MTFAQEIEQYAGDEKIEAIVLSPNRRGSWYRWSGEEDHGLGDGPISWETARQILDYNYDAGYGGQDCHSIIAWTKSMVISVHEYDGSTGLIHVPRNPEKFIEE